MKRFGTLLLVVVLIYPVVIASELGGGAVAYLPLWLSFAWGDGGPPREVMVVLHVAALAVAAAAGIWAGVPITRYLLRAFPLRADGRRRLGCAVMLGLFAVGSTILVLFLFNLGYTDVDRPANLRPKPFPTLIGLVISMGQIAVALRVYASRHDRLERPYILYLRRFNTFSDRVVYQAVLSGAPSGHPVVTLVRASGGPRDFNPWTIGFAGFRFRQPVASLPLPFATPDADWEQHAKLMMERAACIVVDGSQDSPAMATEYGLIRSMDLAAKTIVLRDLESTSAPVDISGASTVGYRRSWWGALHRVVGLYLLAVAYLYMSQDSILEFARPLVALALPFLLIAALQPGIGSESTREIRRRIEGILGSTHASQAEPPRWMARLLALLLLPGGVIGGIAASVGTFRDDGAWTFNLLNLAIAMIFMSSAWQGLQLWRGLAFSRTLVGVIFAAQVLRMAAAGIDYEFCTGLFFGFIINDPGGKHFSLGIGPAMSIDTAATGAGTAALNFVALAALVGLLWYWRTGRPPRT